VVEIINHADGGGEGLGQFNGSLAVEAAYCIFAACARFSPLNTASKRKIRKFGEKSHCPANE